MGSGAAQGAERGSELDQVGAWESRRPCACTVHVGMELRPQEVNFLCVRDPTERLRATRMGVLPFALDYEEASSLGSIFSLPISFLNNRYIF